MNYFSFKSLTKKSLRRFFSYIITIGKYLNDIVVVDIGQPQYYKCLFSLLQFFLSFYTLITLWLTNIINYNVTQVLPDRNPSLDPHHFP